MTGQQGRWEIRGKDRRLGGEGVCAKSIYPLVHDMEELVHLARRAQLLSGRLSSSVAGSHAEKETDADTFADARRCRAWLLITIELIN